MLERILADRLTEHCNRLNIIPRFQFGFKAAHAADMQATRMASILARNKFEKKNSAVLAFDIANAFPSLWPDGLTHKMQKLQFPAYLTRIVANFLANRNLLVKAFGHLSTPRTLDVGCPQGSCISPIIYNIFIADVPTSKDVTILQYADDTAAVASSVQKQCPVNRLEKYGDRLTKYCKRWHLRLCPNKTQYLYVPVKYHPNRFPDRLPSIDGVEVPRTSTMTYLGVRYDSKLAYTAHIEFLKSKVAAKLRTLFALVLGQALNRKNRIKIVKAILWPSILYAAAAWSAAPNWRKVELRRKFSSAAKTILRLPRRTSTLTLQSIINLPLLEVAVAEAKSKLLERLENSATDMEDLIIDIHLAAPEPRAADE